MITTEINSKDSMIRFQEIEQHQEDDEQIKTTTNQRSPQNDEIIILEVQKQKEQSELQLIYEEQLDLQQLQIKEKERLERVKKSRIPLTIQRQLSTINEVSDQSINNSISPQLNQDHQQPKLEDYLFEIQEERKTSHFKELSNGQRQLKKKTKKKKKKKIIQKYTTQNSQKNDIPISELQQNFNIKQYYKDKRIDLSWKILFSYFTLIIISNIILQTIEVIHYSQSICQLNGMENSFIYANQIIYIFGKIGILSLNYQEFTNTLPTKTKIPLFNTVMFSSIFIVLSMPLYVFDFVQCIPRNTVFTLNDSLSILNFLDWGIIWILIIFFVFHFILKISIKKKTWKKLKKILIIMYYLVMLLLHLLQILITFTQSFDLYLPSMIMENYYLTFSIISMIYLTLKKYCFHQEPFQFKHLQLEPTLLIQDEKQTQQQLQQEKEEHEQKLNKENNNEKDEMNEKQSLQCSFKISKRNKSSPQSSSFNSVQTTQINFLRKD